MLCLHPIEVKNSRVPCGQCLHCRINHKRTWAGRILLEGAQNENCFITLTYDNEHLPEGGSLDPNDWTKFKNKLRQWYRQRTGQNLRFFAVGEYGDKTGRAHYHAILFNLSPEHEDTIRKFWGMGHVVVGDLGPGSAQYVAHYTTKKLTNQKDEYVLQKLQGKYPEFARMSRIPPIGAPGAANILAILQTATGQESLKQNGVPRTFRHQGKEWPIGRYWWRWLHQQLKIPVPGQLSTPDYRDLPLKNPGREKNAQKQEKHAAAKSRAYNGRTL